MICGQCKCYSGFRFDAEIGRCRRFNITVQLRTECLEKPRYECRCMRTDCIDKKGSNK